MLIQRSDLYTYKIEQQGGVEVCEIVVRYVEAL